MMITVEIPVHKIMSETGKWKSRLLSSSVPMEYEVAKMLVASGYVIDSDYTYARDDAGLTKDFSVDIRATGYLPFKSKNYRATLELLVECKHRQQGNKWLFFPDPNMDEMSPFVLGRTMRAVDHFSRVFFAPNCTVPFDAEAIFCMKGVEVDASNGTVHDSEIKHGLAQLQYALPSLLADNIRFNMQGHEDDNSPFIFCPILLTTSELFVAHDDISIKSVEHASTLEDIAAPAKYVILHLYPTPDFERHQQISCASLAELAKRPLTKNLDAFRRDQGEYEFRLPSVLCTELANLNSRKFQEYFSQTVVCSLEHFPDLIEEIKKVATKAVKSIKKQRAS